jgi:predicted double-glycine peptidase
MFETVALILVYGAGTVPSGDKVLRPQLCGRYTLDVVIDFLGVQLPTDWELLLPPEQAPFSFHEIEGAAKAAGLDSLIIQWTDPESADLSHPCILHVKASDASQEPDHFLTCFGSDRSAVLLGDYPKMPAWVSREKLRRYWSGTALYLGRPGDAHLSRLRWQMRLAALRRPVGLLLAVSCVASAWLTLRRPSRRGANSRPG